MIPLFDLNFDKEELDAACQPIKDNWISMGPKVLQFENMFSEMLGIRYAVAVTNCTAALHLALYISGIGVGDEVIVPSLTFSATVNCIKYVGATPVFCDINGCDDLGIDVELLETLITDKTRAIIPMHYAGFPCNMRRIMEIASKNNIVVIEDACHGPLSEYEGKKLGTIGNIGCFSFYSNKNISTGEGGMLVTNDESIFQKAKLARSHGMTTLSYDRAKGHAMDYDINLLGFNYRMDDIRASIGCVQLKKLENDIGKRKTVRKMYEEKLGTISSVILPYVGYKGVFSNYIMPIVLKDSNREKRDKFRIKLKERGIQTSVHYPACHRFHIYEDIRCHLPNTEYVADNEITLPMYGKLTEEQVNYICNAISEED